MKNILDRIKGMLPRIHNAFLYFGYVSGTCRRTIIRAIKRTFIFYAIIILAAVALYVTSTGLISGLAGPTRENLELIHLSQIITPSVYYAISYGIVAVLYLLFCFMAYRRVFRQMTIHNKKHLYKLFDSGNLRRVAPSRIKLYVSLTGLRMRKVKALNKQHFFNSLDEVIDENTGPIKNFLTRSNKFGNVLIIDSGWGSGKTTSLLIAANEVRDPYNRYVYESVTKYRDNLSELFDGILHSINEVMVEFGVSLSRPLDSLAKSISPNLNQTAVNLIKPSSSDIILNTELIYKINHKYLRKNHTVKRNEQVSNVNIPGQPPRKDTYGDIFPRAKSMIVIVLDDLDRVQGEDIIKVLSFLSILRCLMFVKIVIPADQRKIVANLEHSKIANPEKLIKEYLPDRKTVRLKSGYELTRKAILTALSANGLASDNVYRNNKNSFSIDAMEPALAAILFHQIAYRMKCEVDSLKNKPNLDWLNNADAINGVVSDSSDILKDIISIPRSPRLNLGNRYFWDASASTGYHFEDFIMKLKLKRGADSRPVSEYFTDDVYNNVIKPWIFDFFATYWDELGFSLRDMLDVMHSVVYSAPEKTPAAQFCQIYNQFVPDDKRLKC